MKDHATFLAAMSTLPHVQGIMVGDGTDQLKAPANVRGLGVRSDSARLYTGADIVVSSSAFGEGFSNAIGEGMSAGLVPVATDCGDARSIIGDTGAVVATQDAVALASRIAAEAALPPEQRVARGLAARARIEREFPITRAIEAFSKLYEAPI
jgi:glycosyltransferase involved in cell wall biosynthesis